MTYLDTASSRQKLSHCFFVCQVVDGLKIVVVFFFTVAVWSILKRVKERCLAKHIIAMGIILSVLILI